jgi:tetratricopeptide (TPR) repeat protein
MAHLRLLGTLTVLTLTLGTASLSAADRGGALSTAGGKLLEYRTADARAAIDPLAGTAATDAEVARELGRVLEQEKKYDDAAANLRKATELAPGDALAFVYLGDVYLRQSKQGDADAAFGKAIQVANTRLGSAPGDAEALYALGTAQLRAKQNDAAIATLQKAIAADSGNALPYLQLGVALAYKNDWQGSLDRLTQAIERNSGLAYAYFYRGMAADRLKRKDLLLNDLQRFVTMAPNAPEASRASAVLKAAKR